MQDEKSQIKQAKLAVGNQKLEYFKNNGEELPLVKKDKSATTMFYVLENGEYIQFMQKIVMIMKLLKQ